MADQEARVRNPRVNRIRQNRAWQVSNLVGFFSDIISGSSENVQPSLLIAAEDLFLDLAQGRRWVMWMARGYLAAHIAEVWARRENQTDAERKMARAYGELTATHVVKDKTTVADRDRAQAHIIDMIRSNPPSSVEMTTYINQVLAMLVNAADVNVTVAEAQSNFPYELPGPPTRQQVVFYQTRAHLIPSAVFANIDQQNQWTTLSTPGAARLVLNQGAFALADGWAQTWVDGGENTLLGFFEGRATADPVPCRKLIAASLLTLISALTKDANITEAWIERRQQRLEAALTGLDIGGYISVGIVREYVKMYPRTGLTSDQIYATLSVCWNQLRAQSVAPLTWIIEQSAFANVTALTALANAVNKLAYFNVEYLLDCGVPYSQFTKVAELCIELIRNKFGSMVEPKVVTREYPDLAYLGICLKQNQMRDANMKAFQGKPETNCQLPTNVILKLAADIDTYNKDMINIQLSVTDQYLTMMRRDNPTMKVEEVGGSIFQWPDTTPLLGGPVTVDAQEDRATLAQQRAAWPRAARALPGGAQQVTHEIMVNYIKGKESPRNAAFKLLMRYVDNLAQQHPLAEMAESALLVPTCYQIVSDEAAIAALAFGYATPTEYKAPPPEFMNPNVQIQGELPNDYFLPILRVSPNARAAPAGQGPAAPAGQNIARRAAPVPPDQPPQEPERP